MVQFGIKKKWNKTKNIALPNNKMSIFKTNETKQHDKICDKDTLFFRWMYVRGLLVSMYIWGNCTFKVYYNLDLVTFSSGPELNVDGLNYLRLKVLKYGISLHNQLFIVSLMNIEIDPFSTLMYFVCRSSESFCRFDRSVVVLKILQFHIMWVSQIIWITNS